MMVVDIVTRPSFEVGTPRVLFEGSYQRDEAGPGNPFYAVSRDGERFLMIKPTGDAEDAHIVVTTNWFEELKARMAEAAR